MRDLPWWNRALLLTTLWAGALLWAGAAAPASAQGDDENTIGRSPNLSGLTGLLLTTSANTLNPWTSAVSSGIIYSHFQSPSADRYEGRLIASLGLPARIEASILLPLIRSLNDNGNPAAPSGSGVGDVQLAGKWRFIDQRGSLWPSVAVAALLTLPTGQDGKKLRMVDDFGAEIKLVASADVDFSPDHYAVGLYAEGGFYMQDIGGARDDKSGLFGVGIVLPLIMRATTPFASPLQFLVEVNGTINRDLTGNVVVLSPSVRYVGPVAVTLAFQYTAIDTPGADSATGVVLLVSLPFRVGLIR